MKICVIEGCGRKHCAKGYCRTHYERLRSGAELHTPISPRIPNRKCEIKGCGAKHKARGFCQLHLNRHVYGTDMEKDKRQYDGTQGCKIVGCIRVHKESGYCASHAVRVRRNARKENLVQKFGGKCKDCSRKFPSYVFDFDNVNATRKHVSINTLLSRGATDRRIQKELLHCELVCSNCHRIRTNNRYTEIC